MGISRATGMSAQPLASAALGTSPWAQGLHREERRLSVTPGLDQCDPSCLLQVFAESGHPLWLLQGCDSYFPPQQKQGGPLPGGTYRQLPPSKATLLLGSVSTCLATGWWALDPLGRSAWRPGGAEGPHEGPS